MRDGGDRRGRLERAGGGKHGHNEGPVLFGPARLKMGPWARVWAEDEARGLARHGLLRYRV